MQRAGRRWTQLQLSLKAKLNQSRISLIENGYADPSPDERARLAKAFGMEEAELFPAEDCVVAR